MYIVYPQLYSLYNPNQPGSLSTSPARGHLSAGGELPAAPTQQVSNERKKRTTFGTAWYVVFGWSFFCFKVTKKEEKNLFFF